MSPPDDTSATWTRRRVLASMLGVVLSDNLLTLDPDGIKDVSVLMTVVGGKIVYDQR